MTETLIRRRVRVAGKVQGVWFRASTQATAQRHGVTGEVRNLTGGPVEAVFQGPAASVEACIEWMRTGPPGAQVRTVEVSEERVVPGERGFSIVR